MYTHHKIRGLVTGCLLFMTALGCGQASESLSGSSGSCIVGESITCPCVDGSTGTRVCTEFGTFADCQCNSVPTADTAAAAQPVGVTTNSGSAAGIETAQQPVLLARADASPSRTTANTTHTETEVVTSGSGLSIPDAAASSDGAASNAITSAAGSSNPAEPVVTTNPGVESGSCITARSVANLTLMDQNSRSPTYNQTRSLHDICGKVLLVMYTSFH